MNEKAIIEKLSGLIESNRLQHSIRVKECAEQLAAFYQEDVGKAALAGLLHDCAKGFDDKELVENSIEYGIRLDTISLYQKGLIHGPLGAEIARHEFGVKDRKILSAIKYHTYGREKMTKLEKIIFLADLIEPGRSYKGVEELRDLAWKDLNRAMLRALDNNLIGIIAKGGLIHGNTLETRNYIIRELGLGKIN